MAVDRMAGLEPLYDQPIEVFIAELASAPAIPAVALGACLVRTDEAGPQLRRLVERAADGETLDYDEQRLLFRAVFILGGIRDPQAFAPLLRLFRRDPEELDMLFGDALTDPLPRILIGAFDGDADALFAAAMDRDADEFVRSGAIGAAGFLTWEGRIAREAMVAFLERFDTERAAAPEDFAWYSWGEAIALLGLGDLMPRVTQAFADGRISETLARLVDLTGDFAAAELAPADVGRFKDAHLGYIEDVLAELQGFPDWTNEEAEDWSEGSFRSFEPIAPYVNPLRDVGRNDPCPCGSGRKAKKCCLAGE